MEKLSAMLMQAKTAKDIESAREKTTQAIENKANAALDRIKAAKEIGHMDIDKLLDILRFVLEVENAGKEKATQTVKPKSITKR